VNEFEEENGKPDKIAAKYISPFVTPWALHGQPTALGAGYF